MNRYWSTQIPPIAVNVTGNNYAGGPATTSRKMRSEDFQHPRGFSGGTPPLSETDISEDEVDGYSFVKIPETRELALSYFLEELGVSNTRKFKKLYIVGNFGGVCRHTLISPFGW